MSERFEIIRYPLSATDERGWVLRPIYTAKGDFVPRNDDEGLGDVSNLHIVSMLPGTVRGNHFHSHQREFLLIMGGKVEVAWQEPGETERHVKILETRDPVILRVPPNTIHAVKNISEEIIYVVCYSRAFAPFPGQDVHKVKEFYS